MDPFTAALIFSAVSGAGKYASSVQDSKTRGLRKDILRKAILAQKRKTLDEGVQRITGMTAAQMASARSGASRRATALGQSAEAESFILPAEGQVGKVGGQLTRDFITSTEQSFDQQLLDVERDAANDPIPLQVTDILSELGASAFKGYLAGEELNVERERTKMIGKAYGDFPLMDQRDRGYSIRDEGYLRRRRAQLPNNNLWDY